MLGQTHLHKTLTILGLASMLNLASVCLSQFVKVQAADSDDQLELPDRREAGGHRAPDACNFNPLPLTALMPENLLGTTAVSSPIIFFYTPPLAQPKEAEFVLYDEKQDERKPIFATTFTITGKEGIMSVSLPADKKANWLKANREYRWQLRIICDKKYPARDAFVEGLYLRVELNPAFANKLDQTPIRERIKLYQEAHLWQETLTALVELKLSHPSDPAV
ncbi:MAG: DUF928 domain-containing protein, partial [Microcystaceae cyanobacterium]